MTKAAIVAAFETLEARGATAARDGMTAANWRTNLDTNVRWLNHKLRARSYRFAGYHLILKPKGRAKAPREISQPRIQDRVVLKCMANFMREMAPVASAPLAQDVIARVISALSRREYTHFLKLDIQNFYPSIDHEWLQAVLKHALKDESIVQLFMDAARAPTTGSRVSSKGHSNAIGVPQGLAISNGLAELCLAHLDKEMASSGVAYFRFVDDVLILLPSKDTGPAMVDAKRLLGMAKLSPHPVDGSGKSATGALSEPFEYLGYRFEGPRLTVRRESISRIEGRIARAFTAYKYAVIRAKGDAERLAVAQHRLVWHIDLLITGCRFEGHAVGWLVYFSQIRHQQLLHHLDSMISSKAARFGVAENTQFKRFVAAYRLLASRRPDRSGYIPNFDEWTIDQMRTALNQVFGVSLTRLANEGEAKSLFYARIRKEVKDLERDVEAVAYR